MLHRILKSNHPFLIVFIIVSGFLLWLNSIIQPSGAQIPSDVVFTPFYGFILDIVPFSSRASVLVTFILVLVLGLFLIQFNIKYILIENRTFAPAFIYILLTGSFIQLQRINPAIIGTLFIFWAVNIIYDIYRNDYALNKLFLAGFLISLASLIWPPFVVYLLIVFIALTILRPISGREWVVPILGFLTPYLFVSVYYYTFFDKTKLVWFLQNLLQSLDLLKFFTPLHFSYYILFGYLLLVLVMASYSMIINFQKKKIRTRKYFELNWWIFAISLGMVVFFKNVGYEIIYLMAYPVAFLLTDYFYSMRKPLFLNSILGLLALVVVFIQIMAKMAYNF